MDAKLDSKGRWQLITGGSDGVHIWDGVKPWIDGLPGVEPENDVAHGG